MTHSTIVVFDMTGTRHVASRKFMDTGIDAVVYRIAEGQLIYQQSDGSFADARKTRFRLAEAHE